MQALALAALSAQNTALVLLTKFSHRAAARRYSTSTVVACAEVAKFGACCLLQVISEGRRALPQMFSGIRTGLLQLALPSLLYVVQNNLIFEAMRLLQPTVYMVCSQSKILTSALFGVLLTDTVITPHQMIALCLLVFGMVAVQYGETNSRSQSGFVLEDGHLFKGVCCALSASTTSGFAGAYLERLYKGLGNDRQKQSIWHKNVQLSFFSIPMAIVTVWIRDRQQVKLSGVFHGYDYVVVSIVVLQAVGGLIIAAVMRYAGNVLKCFAVSTSICSCALFSSILQPQATGIDIIAATGICFVIFATFLFSTKSGGSRNLRPSPRTAAHAI